MFSIPTNGDQPTHNRQPTTRWRTLSQQGAAATIEEDVSGRPESGKLAVTHGSRVVSSVADPDPNPPDPRVLGLLDPDPKVTGMDPDPFIIKQKMSKKP